MKTTKSWRLTGAVLLLSTAILLASPGGLANACHLPENLKEIAEDLSAAQLALAAHGGSHRAQIPYSLEAVTDCENGFADIFPCANVDLLAHLPLNQIGGGTGNDIWGWFDRVERREYALVGRSNGVAVVDVSDPENPVYLANMPTHASSSAWRDIKVYKDHAFVVADFAGNHGMQVFDLADVRSITNPPVTLTEAAHYPGFSRAHNIAINEVSGYAYAVGSNTCSGGLHMIDIREPLNPTFAGCFADDGYTHDVQCVYYKGPDLDYRFKEICFASNEDTVTIVDVSDKSNPVMLSRNGYQGSRYTHQGWLSRNQDYFLHDDELDERDLGHATRTYIWDISDLQNPGAPQVFTAAGNSIDHNQYIRGRFSFQANYRRGLRILNLVNPGAGNLVEVAYFDTYPEADGNNFDGAWSVYPYFTSRIALVSDINRGLFVLKPILLGDEFFYDDFEAGDLALWTKSRGRAVDVVEPGLKGSLGALRVDLEAGKGASFVSVDHAPGERAFSASFLLAAGGTKLGRNEIEVMQLRGQGDVLASLTLEQRGRNRRANLYALEEGGDYRFVGSADLPARRAIAITVEWQRGAGDRDGSASLFRKGKRVGHIGDLATAGSVVDEVRLGLPSRGEGTAGSGSFVVDEYSAIPPEG
jgi:choice-of-anchor B domain-containing protein